MTAITFPWKSLRAAEVSFLGNATFGKLGENRHLTTFEYFALRKLEMTSPHSPLKNNIRLAKLRPNYVPLLSRIQL